LLLDAWKSSLEWENIFFGLPLAVIIIVFILFGVHKLRVLEPRNVYHFQLNCTKLASEYDLQLFTWQFIHKDCEHLNTNLVLFFIYGGLVESILGTIPFGFLFFYLCYSIPREWYHADESCQTPRTIVGLSGVICALGPIAILLTLYRTICILSRMKFFSPDGSEKPKLALLGLSYLTGLALSLVSVIYVYLKDTISPDPDTATDIHFIGTKQGFWSALPVVVFVVCILQDLLRPIINKAKARFWTRLCRFLGIHPS